MALLTVSLAPGVFASDVCGACHPAIAARYAKSSMANSVRPVSAASTIEQVGVTFDHALSGRHYEVLRSGGGIRQKRTLSSGEDPYELQATHVIGSGKHARSYVSRANSGELVQLPLSWYTQEHQWGMSPGYDAAKHFDFTRMVDSGCLFCHTAYPVGKQVHPALNGGVDCQRCHGAGSAHIAAASSRKPPKDIRAAIVNPARISNPSKRLDVCLQCHLQSTSEPLPHAMLRIGRGVFSFRPGEALSDYAVHFERARTSERQDRFEINSHGYRLISSPCFAETPDGMQCTSCHDPHGESSSAAVMDRTRQTCLGCHQPHTEAGRQDCVSCHMPRRRAGDAVHVVMTDHRIQRPDRRLPSTGALAERHDGPYRGSLELLTPNLQERDLYLGMAYAEGGADLATSIKLLHAYIANSAKPTPQAFLQLGKAYEKSGNLTQALSWFQKGVSAGLAGPIELATLGDLLLRAGHPKQAELQFRAALPLAGAHLGLGNALLRQKHPEQAVPHWEAATSASAQTRLEASNNLGAWLIQLGRIAEAEKTLLAALAFDPSSAEANNNLGRLLAAKGDLAGGVKRVERSVELDPQYAQARFNHGRLLHALERREKAMAEYREALRLDPNLAEAHLSLGVLLAEANQMSDAAVEFREALRLQPANKEAVRNLKLAEEILKDRR
ncbi:MAG: tetratricopeptide repeat protein [Bryobacteraceae bacterium]|nr:tetratricopeptide repeat protein [Bryobacteraceae bacterium]